MFDEKVFLYALTTRPEDAKRFALTFKPSWLRTTELIPVLAEVFAFTRKHGEPPSVQTLHSLFKDKDESAYTLRYKDVLDSLAKEEPDRSSVIYTLGQARDVGVVRDFQELSNDQAFLKKQAELSGSDVLKIVHKFLNKHGDTGSDRTMDVKEAIDHLIDAHGFLREAVRIPTGVDIIDEWTGGGLRTKQIGIVLAPTGAGKSTFLVVIAHKMAVIENKRIWVVTNELSLEEQTERLLARITGTDLTEVIDYPAVAYKGLDRHWRQGLQDRLRLTEINREVSADDIEAEMGKWVNMLGWKPDVLVLDFMERMKPVETGYSRNSPWDWLGAICRDLSRLAKRHNLLIWTAAQTNRSGLNNDNPMSLDVAQSSIKHLQEATSVIGMRQHQISDEKMVMEFASLKQRQSKRVSRSVYLECNLAKMSISNTIYSEPDAEPESDGDDDPTPKEQLAARKGLVPKDGGQTKKKGYKKGYKKH